MSSQHPVAVLTRDEKQSLDLHEQTIRKGLDSFMEVGISLKEIRDGRLWRGEFQSFDAYCQNKWNIAKSYAHYQIKAAEVAAKVVHNCGQSPLNEGQVRELAKAGDAAPKVLKEATKRAVKDEKPVTAKLIAEVRDELLSKPKPVPPPPVPSVNGVDHQDEPPYFEPPVEREIGEDDDEPPKLDFPEEWSGSHVNQLIKAITYLEKVAAAEGVVVKRIGRLYAHHKLPLNRWTDELHHKSRELKQLRQRLENAKAAKK